MSLQMAASLPSFSSLPLNKNDPPYSAWGLYGKNDRLGTLNRLTDDVVLEASKEIKTGKRFSLNWPLSAQGNLPFFRRQAFEHNIIEKAPRCVNDDTWNCNTQSSSQWDGLRHFGYQKERKFYNGVTMGEIHEENSSIIGIQEMAKEGIVGRGVLLDFCAWRLKNPVAYDPFETNSITYEQLQAVVKEQNVEFRFGDILIIRSGFTQEYYKLDKESIHAMTEIYPHHFGGVERSEDNLRWIWENFAAVAGDLPAFECLPFPDNHWSFHEVLLAGWGCPIGELFDLEALAAHCQQVKRWTFFLTSEPCNVSGGVASPPNILAIF